MDTPAPPTPTQMQFEKMAVRIAHHYKIAPPEVVAFDDLPEWFRGFVAVVEYRHLITPLVWADREGGKTWQQLATKYHVSIMTVRTILGKRR